jgi:hypothetical protein
MWASSLFLACPGNHIGKSPFTVPQLSPKFGFSPSSGKPGIQHPSELSKLSIFSPLLVLTVVLDDVAVDPTCQSAPTSLFSSYSLHHPLPLKAAIGTTSWTPTLSFSTADGSEGALDLQERGGSTTHCGRIYRKGHHALLHVVSPLRCCPLVWPSDRICGTGHRRAAIPR